MCVLQVRNEDLIRESPSPEEILRSRLLLKYGYKVRECFVQLSEVSFRPVFGYRKYFLEALANVNLLIPSSG